MADIFLHYIGFIDLLFLHKVKSLVKLRQNVVFAGTMG